jgi:hypothetical protein
MNFYFIIYWFYVFESLACCMIDVSKIENALNELNMILLLKLSLLIYLFIWLLM